VTPAIRPLTCADLESVRELATIAAAEGFQFLGRLIIELENGWLQLGEPAEFFLCVVLDARLVAVGGVTPDPYVTDAQVGRLRHVYVHPDYRGMNLGRLLVRELESRAATAYPILRLRTDTIRAARFYESLGYRVTNSAHATHVRP
jgi:GNAT superfamily N-acetyltransferase